MARITLCSQLLPSLLVPVWQRNHYQLMGVICTGLNRGRRFSAASSSKISMSLKAGIVGLPNVGKSTLFNVVGFLCPETGQEFSTYQDLMCYVRYAKAAQLSIYSPDQSKLSQYRDRRFTGSQEEFEQALLSINDCLYWEYVILHNRRTSL